MSQTVYELSFAKVATSASALAYSLKKSNDFLIACLLGDQGGSQDNLSAGILHDSRLGHGSAIRK
jgi:hypothetical protein